jgi:lipoprotein-releasing system permease protein
MLMSLSGIVFGIGFFIVTQAQTSGFESFYIKTIIGTDGPLRIEDRFQYISKTVSVNSKEENKNNEKLENFIIKNKSPTKYIQGIEYPNKLKDALNCFRDVNAISEVLIGNAIAKSLIMSIPVRIHGIRIQDHTKVTNLSNQIVFGNISNFLFNKNGALIGKKIADQLDISIGDYLILETVYGNFHYFISGIFETGINDIDKQRIFIHIEQSRILLGSPFGKSIFQISINNPEIAEKIAKHIAIATNYNAKSWKEREKTWLEVFKVLRLSSGITVSSIILISGLGMFNTLATLVFEKSKEIAILRSVGFFKKDIYQIFLLQGGLILILGSLIGGVFGAFTTYGISKLPIRIRGIFSTDNFIVQWNIYHYLWAFFIAFIVVFISSYIPAKRASNIEPGNIIRGTSI